MSKLKAEVTTRTEVDLSTSLVTKLKAKLLEYRYKKLEAKTLATDLTNKKNELEMLFADAGEYEALEEGVRIVTPLGEVPMKIVKGQTAKKLNVTRAVKLLIKLGATKKQVEACYDPPKDKKPYLGVWLPDEADDAEVDE